MAATDRTGAASAEGLAARIRDAAFVHLLVRADGASLAAASLLADGCEAAGTPYQLSVVETRADVETRSDAADEGTTTVAVGLPGGEGPTGRPSVTAFDAAAALGAEPDPVLALAGVVADGDAPEDAAPELVDRAGVERRPGLSAPTADPADGLAHTTLAHAPYSGDLDAAEAVVAEISAGGEPAGRRLASVLAIDAVRGEGATERAAHAIERAIHPLAVDGGSVETVEGYADVLRALSAEAPGVAVGLALGGPADEALDVWREHARDAHEGVRSAETGRNDGLLVAETAGPVRAVARLLRDFRSPEPAVLVVGEGEAALATVDGPARPIESAAEAAGGSGLAGPEEGEGPSGGPAEGYARFEAGREDALVDAVVEAR